MSIVVNMKCVILSFGFIKQLTIADINITHTFIKKIKHHWDSFSVSEMFQEKLHRVVVNNVDA